MEGGGPQLSHSCSERCRWNLLDERKAEISAPESLSVLFISGNNWPDIHTRPLNRFRVFDSLVYPSLESEEDNPVFKSRSKKRKSNDDTPYSPTGKYRHFPPKFDTRELMCSQASHGCRRSARWTLGSPTGAAGERRRASGLHRNGSGRSSSKALPPGKW